MSNDDRTNDFSQSITAAFMVASFQNDEPRYTPSKREYRKDMPAFLRDQLDGTDRPDHWRSGWHNGFPPTSGA